MHELSIAMGIIEIATEEAARLGAERVTALHLKLGPLSGVVKEALEFSYELACEGTCVAGSQLIIQDVPVVIHCANCDEDRVVESIQNLRCDVCGELSADVRQGRELAVVALEVEQPEVFVS